jgi:hypothetical protein
VKATIAAVRKVGPYLRETDSELMEIVIEEAMFVGLIVAFDLRE